MLLALGWVDLEPEIYDMWSMYFNFARDVIWYKFVAIMFYANVIISNNK